MHTSLPPAALYTIAGIGSIRHRVNESPSGRVAAAIAAADPTDGDLDLFDASVRARLDADLEQSWCIQIVLDADADELKRQVDAIGTEES